MKQPTPESLAMAAKHDGGEFVDTYGDWDMYERAFIHRGGNVFWSAGLKVFEGATIVASGGEIKSGGVSLGSSGISLGYRDV